MKDKLTKQELGIVLRARLDQGYDVVKLSRWAYSLFFKNSERLISELDSVLEYLFSMEDDPQFEYTEEQLRVLAQLLIDNEDSPIEKLHQIIRKQESQRSLRKM